MIKDHEPEHHEPEHHEPEDHETEGHAGLNEIHVRMTDSEDKAQEPKPDILSLVKEINVLRLRPHDVLVIKVPETTAPATIDSTINDLKQALINAGHDHPNVIAERDTVTLEAIGKERQELTASEALPNISTLSVLSRSLDSL